MGNNISYILKIIWCSSWGGHKEAVQTNQKKGGENCCLLAAEESKEHLASDSGSVSCWFFDSGIFSYSWLGVADIPIGFSLPTEIKILKDVILSKSLVFSQKTHHMFSYASLSFAIVSISMPSQIFSLCIT